MPAPETLFHTSATELWGSRSVCRGGIVEQLIGSAPRRCWSRPFRGPGRWAASCLARARLSCALPQPIPTSVEAPFVPLLPKRHMRRSLRSDPGDVALTLSKQRRDFATLPGGRLGSSSRRRFGLSRRRWEDPRVRAAGECLLDRLREGPEVVGLQIAAARVFVQVIRIARGTGGGRPLEAGVNPPTLALRFSPARDA